MRTTSVAIDTGTAAHITQPAYLVEVLLETPLYWSTAGALSWDGKSWLATGLEVQRISEAGGTIRIRNDDNSGSALVLNSALRDTEFRVYSHYNGDAVEIFRGYGGAASVSAMTATIHLHAHRAAGTKAPRGRITAPTFTRLPKKGEVIRWGGDEIIVEA